MSGHSKWSTIKHQKAIEDSKRSAVFTKIAKKITLAAMKGDSKDVNINPFLRAAVEDARAVNMPMDNVKRAIEKAFSGSGSAKMEEISYEAYGPGGVGMIVTVLTDNRNRTGGIIKNLFDKNGSKLGGTGSVLYLKNLNPVPKIELLGEDREKFARLIEALESIEEVVEVWENSNKND